ncbi:LIM zinc-binding domain-containing [Takifugu flavidus]|uniref:LIM zinc-binding domain-containing n=1 Tax=Takifugu flavidus TaxID=433684 RepID=A0A5C6P2U1_9TELE|nr:LIM zinc-binding domain-containing [Takifugu flavidus]
MNPQCARCGKIVYPTEKVSCLDTCPSPNPSSPSLLLPPPSSTSPPSLLTSLLPPFHPPPPPSPSPCSHYLHILPASRLTSLELGKVPTLWKTSCIIPVPKKNRPSELNDFRPVALTSHLMKTLERLFLNLLRPQVQHAEDSLQFAYRDKDKLLQMRVTPAWLLGSSYLTDRPQFVRMKDITSDTVRDEEEEYRCLVRDFVAWCHNNSLQLTPPKTKELVIDFGRDRPRPRPVQIGTEEVQTYNILGCGWTTGWTEQATRGSCTKTQRDVLPEETQILQHLEETPLDVLPVCGRQRPVLRCGVLGGECDKSKPLQAGEADQAGRLGGGMKLEPLATVAERRTIDKLRSIMDNVRHPLHTVVHSQRSLISQRLRLPKFRTNRLGNSFIPRAIRLFSSSLGGRRANRRTGTTLQ